MFGDIAEMAPIRTAKQWMSYLMTGCLATLALAVMALRRRWLIAFAFGLIHGFGFSFALRDTLQFAGEHLVTSLLAFNLGVELGQLAVLVVLVPALSLLFRYVVAERIGTIISNGH